jgi:hypothetical protein
MGSRQRYIEVAEMYEITSGAAIDILQYEEDIQEIIFKMLAEVDHPGVDVYDYYAFNIDDKLLLKVSIFGGEDDMFTLYSIEDVHDMDLFLDYVNLNKAIVWNTNTMTLRRL